jgi:hypothetical protein
VNVFVSVYIILIVGPSFAISANIFIVICMENNKYSFKNQTQKWLFAL